MSRTEKIKHNWSRDIGAGFIKEDIEDVMLRSDGSIAIMFTWNKPSPKAFALGNYQNFKVSELNLRETEEAIKFLEQITEEEAFPNSVFRAKCPNCRSIFILQRHYERAIEEEIFQCAKCSKWYSESGRMEGETKDGVWIWK